PESSEPMLNVCLLPDRESLRGERLPYEWKYEGKRWLTDFVRESREGLQSYCECVANSWTLPGVHRGTLPEDEHPDVFMSVPLVMPVTGDREHRIMLFDTKRAAKKFFESMKEQGFEVRAGLRSIRPIRLEIGPKRLVVAYDPAVLGELARIEVRRLTSVGKLEVIYSQSFIPKEDNGPTSETIQVNWKPDGSRSLYALASLTR